MATEITTSGSYPKAANGLTLPLRKSLGSQALTEHRAMLALELEVLSKKVDRFGWDRDRNSPVHDRLVIDWMDALQDYPLDEVRAACREAIKARPNHTPNEGHIVGEIMKARAAFVQMNRPVPKQEPQRDRISAERAAEIMAEVGFRPQRFGGTDE